MRKGSYIGTYNSGRFWVKDPKVKDINIEGIAHSLSQICRFTGGTEFFWSVAQHSLLVHHIVDNLYIKVNGDIDLLKIVALLHDASEAYLCDIAKPIKDDLKEYGEIEENVQNTIYKAFGITDIPDSVLDDLKRADELALQIEALTLMEPCEDWKKKINVSSELYSALYGLVKLENKQIVKGRYLKVLNDTIGTRAMKDIDKIMEYAPNKNCLPIIDKGECKLYVEELENFYRIHNNFKFIDIDKSFIDNTTSITKLLVGGIKFGDFGAGI